MLGVADVPILGRLVGLEGDRPSGGILHVVVGGTFVVRDGAFVEGVYPGEAIRGGPAS